MSKKDIVVAKVLTVLIIFVVLFDIAFFLLSPSGKKVLQIPQKILQLTDLKSVQADSENLREIQSIEDIFSSNHMSVGTLSAEKVVTLIATGDVIPARSTNNKVVTYNDPLWPYRKTADVVKDADLTMINLETPLLKACTATIEGMIFCGIDKNVEGLKFAGVDVATIANNHIGNYGVEGVNATAKLLSDNGILSTSQNGPVFKTVKGLKFAFLAYNDIGAPEDGVSWADIAKIKEQVANAKANADVVVVSYHWGIEYVDQPNERQKELGHITIDSGADLVIGNHPHWIQPVEFYKGKLITYAHGNFVFDQMWSQKTREGVVGKYIFYNKKLVDVTYLPILISDYGQPEFMTGSEKERILSEMRKQSEILKETH